jgi:hypothetical protein
MLAIARVECRQCLREPLDVLRLDSDQSIDVESSHWRALQHRRDAADDDVFDAVVLKQLEDSAEA